MFICDQCLLEHYENGASLGPRSRGPCEICKRTTSCNDIPTNWLRLKNYPLDCGTKNVSHPPIRTREDIETARNQLSEALEAGWAIDPDQMIHATTATMGMIKALKWVLGSDEPGGFGDMIKELNQVSPPRKPS